VPLTRLQQDLINLLAVNREPDSYLAGGAAIHISPQSVRFSNGIDLFHDSEKKVAESFNKDKRTLEKNKFLVSIELNQPGYIRAVVSNSSESTKIEWAQDSAWRFMPTEKSKEVGYILHPVDLAVNKVLAIAGRDEARDLIDICEISNDGLSLGSLTWAACGKDPGFNPQSLLELIKRRGRVRPEDLSRLMLSKEIDLNNLKKKWLSMIEEAEDLIRWLPLDQVGCLYYNKTLKKFVTPDKSFIDTVPHFGRYTGVSPTLKT
jgi:hypothetical protein